ncbi:hypothetical protein FGG08_006890 [Glutinoglossum americanum]|uniref:Protein kinase domain-containing protein n=1 Tax=Glutinoglossum americanum TaxID=1670608 RepID=A0A9P8I0D6_9PEZI|nr:hypothetical protein FGG08_006890 [Glutinoglossum americanum]
MLNKMLARLANITPQDQEEYAHSVQQISQYYKSHAESIGQVSVDTLPWDLFPTLDKQNRMIITPAAATETAVMLCATFEIWSTSGPNIDEWHLTERVVAMGRICLILQAMNKRILLQNFVTAGKTDLSLPFTECELESILGDETAREGFFKQQHIATVRDLLPGMHGSFSTDELLPLRHLENLGTGAFGSVDSVANVFTGKVYARKIFRSRKRGSRNIFETEISALRKLQSHHHIVQLVASYVHVNVMALVLLPVADSNLHDLLSTSATSRDRTGTYQILFRCFGCLASGLAFMHSQRIRHKDIKPQNILVHQSSVLLTDFGLAFDFGDSGASTTYGRPEFLTRKYCAPEAAAFGRRGRKSDVFSLGCVLLEVATVLCGIELELFEEFLSDGGPFHQNIAGALQWVGMLQEGCNDITAILPLHTCRQMLQTKAEDRPCMDDVLVSLVQGHSTTNTSSVYFCEVCLKHPNLRDILSRTVVEIFGKGEAETSLCGPDEKPGIRYKDRCMTLGDDPRVENSVAIPAKIAKTMVQIAQPPAAEKPMVVGRSLAQPISSSLASQEQDQHHSSGEEHVVKAKPLIRFIDAVGRKFSLPFHKCQTWEGMEELITQAFLHIEVIGPRVAQGHYDLCGPNEEIILPQVWEAMIEPGWTVTMVMWPVPEPPPPPPSPPPPLLPPPPPSIPLPPPPFPSPTVALTPGVVVANDGSGDATPPSKEPSRNVIVPLLMWMASRSKKP